MATAKNGAAILTQVKTLINFITMALTYNKVFSVQIKAQVMDAKDTNGTSTKEDVLKLCSAL